MTFELTMHIIERAGPSCTTCMSTLQANVKLAHLKFKGRTFCVAVSASNSVNACSFSTTDHTCAWTVSTPAPYGHLHMKQQPCYAFELYTHNL